jgi:hypothetical protein
LPISQKQLKKNPLHIQLLVEHEHAVGYFFTAFRKLIAPNIDNCMLAGSVPHLVHLTYKEVLLVSLFLSLGIC